MEEILKNENTVSDKIRNFIKKKKGVVEKHAEERDRLKDKKINELQEEKEKIHQQKEQATLETSKLTELCEAEEEDRKARDLKDQEAADLEQAKIKEKLDMNTAASYVQKKWHWFQTEGKLLGKKRKGKGGKKKKGKK